MRSQTSRICSRRPRAPLSQFRVIDSYIVCNWPGSAQELSLEREHKLMSQGHNSNPRLLADTGGGIFATSVWLLVATTDVRSLSQDGQSATLDHNA